VGFRPMVTHRSSPSGDASAYQYLLSGVAAFAGAPQFSDEIRAQRFVDVGYERLSLGIVAIYTARKPRTGGV
jgi:ubiquinone/menaquinone biosynthesis C-methylase UbiE